MDKERSRAGGGAAPREEGKNAPSIAAVLRRGGVAVREWGRTLGERLALAGSDAPLGMLRALGFCALGFLLGGTKTLFGAMPLGIALLCSASSYIPFILLGLATSALTIDGGSVTVAVYIAATGLRLLARALIDPPREGEGSRLFCEGLYLRMATAAVSAFAVGLYRVIAGGFYFYDLWGAIFSTSIAPVAVVIYCSLFGDVEIAPERESRRGARFYAVCYHAVLFSVCLSFREVGSFGFSAVHGAVCACTLFALRQRGRRGAVAAGALCGLSAGGIWSPLYAIAGLAASALIAVSPLAAATAVLACSTLFCLFFGSAQDFVFVFPAQLLGLCAFCAWGILSRRFSVAASALAEGDTVSDGELKRRLGALSHGYAELARDFSRLAEYGRYPSFGELRAACDRACDACCPDCENKKLCWELEYSSTVKIIDSICRGGAGGRAPSADMLPEYMRRRCARLPHILRLVSDEYRAMCARGDGGAAAFAAEYAVISAVLEGAIEHSAAEGAYCEEESEAARRILRRHGIGFSSLAVRGTRRKRVSAQGVDLSRAGCRMGELRAELEEAVGCALAPAALTPQGDRIEFLPRRRLCVGYGAARSAADGNEACGDRLWRVEREDGVVYALLCDGMGTGYDAAMASGKCGLFLRRMLAAGMSAPHALEAVNLLLRKDGGECTVSLDLVAVDTVTGEASLYKSGAAPTYLRRGGKVFPIDAPSIPLGILAEPELTRSDFSLYEGDVLVLSSDGVDADGSIADGRSVWLFDVIGSELGEREMASRAVRAARQSGSRDDISVIVLKISAEAP